MSVDTVVFVVIDNDKSKMFNAVRNVSLNLQRYISDKCKEYASAAGLKSNKYLAINELKKQGFIFTYRITNYVDFEMDTFNLVFGCGDKSERNIFISNNSCDQNHIVTGNKLFFSLGCWGSNKDIAKIICESLKEFGDVYYDINDCDDIDYQKYQGEIK